MGFAQRVMVMFFLVMAALEVSLAAVYKVGDSTGWTIQGKFNYTAWAASKTFRVGDTIVFEYNRQFHNVLRVTHTDYQACKASSPMETYASGNDTIVVNKAGHHYYLCGIPGHCLVGQKVDINVLKSSEGTAPSGSPAPSPSSSPSGSGPGAEAPGPSEKNSAPYPSKGLLGKLGMVVLALGVCVSVFFNLGELGRFC